MLNLEPFWLRLAKTNSIFFNSLANGVSCISAPQFRKQTAYSFRNTELIVTIGSTGADIRTDILIVKYSFL